MTGVSHKVRCATQGAGPETGQEVAYDAKKAVEHITVAGCAFGELCKPCSQMEPSFCPKTV